MVGKWKRRKLEIPRLTAPSNRTLYPWFGKMRVTTGPQASGSAWWAAAQPPAGIQLAVRLRCAHSLGPGRLAGPADYGFQFHKLPARLEWRIALGQDLEAALEEAHVPVPQKIQPLSLTAPRLPFVLHGRHAATEAPAAVTRKQLAIGAKEPQGAIWFGETWLVIEVTIHTQWKTLRCILSLVTHDPIFSTLSIKDLDTPRKPCKIHPTKSTNLSRTFIFIRY